MLAREDAEVLVGLSLGHGRDLTALSVVHHFLADVAVHTVKVEGRTLGDLERQTTGSSCGTHFIQGDLKFLRGLSNQLQVVSLG